MNKRLILAKNLVLLAKTLITRDTWLSQRTLAASIITINPYEKVSDRKLWDKCLEEQPDNLIPSLRFSRARMQYNERLDPSVELAWKESQDYAERAKRSGKFIPSFDFEKGLNPTEAQQRIERLKQEWDAILTPPPPLPVSAPEQKQLTFLSTEPSVRPSDDWGGVSKRKSRFR